MAKGRLLKMCRPSSAHPFKKIGAGTVLRNKRRGWEGGSGRPCQHPGCHIYDILHEVEGGGVGEMGSGDVLHRVISVDSRRLGEEVIESAGVWSQHRCACLDDVSVFGQCFY